MLIVLIVLAGLGSIVAFRSGARGAYKVAQQTEQVTRMSGNLVRALGTGAVIVAIEWAVVALWPRVAKWALLSATYLMNTWVFWAAGSASGVVLHTVAPLVVVIAAEAVTDVQQALTQCVPRAHTTVHRAQQSTRPEPVTRAAVNDEAAGLLNPLPPPYEPTVSTLGKSDLNTGQPIVTTLRERLVNPAAGAQRAPRPIGEPHRKPAKRSRTPVRRKLLADYLGEARAAWSPGMVVTPAWVRQVTDCSRGLSSKVAAALTTELGTAHDSTARIESAGRAA